VIRDTHAGVEVDVRVIPRSRKTEIAGVRDEALLMRVTAPPVEHAANQALIDYLSAALDVPRRAIRIVSGEHGRRKRVAIDGVAADKVRQLARGR